MPKANQGTLPGEAENPGLPDDRGVVPGERSRHATWEELKPDLMNANAGTERGAQMLEESLSTLGWGGAGTVDRDLNIIGGNKSLEQAMAMGLRPVVVRLAPDEVLVAQREDLDLYSQDDPRGRDLATALNRVAEVNLDWRDVMLQAAQERQGAKSRDILFFANERQGLAAREAKAEAKEADQAEADQESLDVKPRQAPRFRQVYVVTCKGEDEAAMLTEWLTRHGIDWKDA